MGEVDPYSITTARAAEALLEATAASHGKCGSVAEHGRLRFQIAIPPPAELFARR